MYRSIKLVPIARLQPPPPSPSKTKGEGAVGNCVVGGFTAVIRAPVDLLGCCFTTYEEYRIVNEWLHLALLIRKLTQSGLAIQSQIQRIPCTLFRMNEGRISVKLKIRESVD